MLDWISRCLSPLEEQWAGASERAQLRTAMIDRSGAGPPAPALSGWGCSVAYCPPWSLKMSELVARCFSVPWSTSGYRPGLSLPLPPIRNHLVGPVRQTRTGLGRETRTGLGREPGSEKMDESLMSPFPNLSWRQPWGTKGRPWECPLLLRIPGAKRGPLWKEGIVRP